MDFKDENPVTKNAVEYNVSAELGHRQVGSSYSRFAVDIVTSPGRVCHSNEKE